MADFDEVVRLIEGLSNEVSELRAEMRAGFERMGVTVDRQELRVERHGALLQLGSRWTNRMNKWFENMDRMMAIWDERNERMEQRLRKLESGRHQP
jgi:hypothetical protein